MPLLTHPTEWLARHVRNPSVTPAHAGPRALVPGEARIAAQLAQWFREFGGEVIQENVYENRPNTYGIWRNPSSNKWIALDCHVDTVGVEQMPGDPFGGEIKDGRVWGRGAVDDKASFAVALALLESMHAQQQLPAANLIIAAVADEEMLLGGGGKFAAWLRANQIVPDELLIAEPTNCAPCYGHKGVARITCRIHGVAAHTSQPHMGANAISAADDRCDVSANSGRPGAFGI